MKYILLMLIVLTFLIGMAVAEHKDFVNAEGAHISYDIDEYGWVSNGYFQARNIILHFADVNGEQGTPYITDQGFKGWIKLKFCDDEYRDRFLVELVRYDFSTPDNDWDQEIWAEFSFNGNCDCH